MPEPPLVVPIRSDKFSFNMAVKSVLCDLRSEFQQITIVDTYAFGKALLLDGHIQFTELDEHAYHECLVHIPMMALGHPKRVLVVGGGDGGVIRELCRHETLERIDIVEIDQAVIEACSAHLPSLSDGAFHDARVHVHVADAFPFVRAGANGPYDLIVLDSTDTYEEESGEISEMLFTQDFYRDCAAVLAPGGLVVTQADNLVFCPYSVHEIAAQFGKVFPKSGSYWGIVPSFGGFSGFFWASLDGELAQEFDSGRIPAGMRYLNEVTYRLAMGPLPFSTEFASS